MSLKELTQAGRGSEQGGGPQAQAGQPPPPVGPDTERGGCGKSVWAYSVVWDWDSACSGVGKYRRRVLAPQRGVVTPRTSATVPASWASCSAPFLDPRLTQWGPKPDP